MSEEKNNNIFSNENFNSSLPSKKGTWRQAFVALALPLTIFFSFRHFVIEPFVIPSESMRPGLLVHDFILVKKFSYGLRLPFTDSFLHFRSPKRGSVVVFRYPPAPHIFYIKRVIGLPGDTVEVSNGRVRINSIEAKYDNKTGELIQNLQTRSQPSPLAQALEDNYEIFTESIEQNSQVVQFREGTHADFGNTTLDVESFQVPEDSYFVMGDNRDNSQDSRFWGFVRRQYIVGEPWKIWLSCESTLESSSMVCDPRTIRKARIWLDIR